jgi:hypothetical protein
MGAEFVNERELGRALRYLERVIKGQERRRARKIAVRIRHRSGR